MGGTIREEVAGQLGQSFQELYGYSRISLHLLFPRIHLQFTMEACGDAGEEGREEGREEGGNIQQIW